MRKLWISVLALATTLVFTAAAPPMPTSAQAGEAGKIVTKASKAKKAKRGKKARKARQARNTVRPSVAVSATAASAAATAATSPREAEAENMAVVAHNDLGGRGYNADVWEHEGYAYVGQWGFSDWAQGSKERFCPEPPNSGIAVVEVDATDPANVTRRVSTLQNPVGTSAEDVVVYTAGAHAATPANLRGHDIAASGIQVCGGPRTDRSIFRGIILWDVTNPANPVELGRLSTGCCTRGLHELEVEHHANGRTYAYASVPTSEYEDEDSPSGFRDEQGRGDFRLIDITDPRSPVEVSDWGVVHDAGGPLGPGQGCDPDPVYGHSAEPSADGRTVFLSYWDSGFIALDVSNPANPAYLRDSDYEPNEDGDAHSSMYDDARGLLFSADEDFCKVSGPDIEKGLGYLRIWDFWAGTKPVQLSTFRTPNSIWPTELNAGDYTIHNPFLVGTDVYISWYSDGVRVVDTINPNPDPTTDEENLHDYGAERAYFVPPAAQNPVKPSQRGVLSQTPQVWGVVVRESADPNAGRCETHVAASSCLVYASDMNSGLWILRRTD